MKRVAVGLTLVWAIMLLCSCQSEEKLPRLDNDIVIGYENCVAKPDRIRLEYHYVSDVPDDSVYIGNLYPALDFTLIKTLPIYEEACTPYVNRSQYPSISETDREQYALSVEEIARELGADFERYEYQGENSYLGEKFINYYIGDVPGEKDNGGEFEICADRWDFYIENGSLNTTFGDCIERDLDKIDNKKISGDSDEEFIEEVNRLNEIQAHPLSDDTKAELEEFWNRLSEAAPFLFKEKCRYMSCGQGEGSGYSMRSDSVWLRYTKEDISSDRGRLLDYNGFVDGYEIYFRDNDTGERDYVGVSYTSYCGSRLEFVGEYKIVSSEEAVRELKLEDGEQLALLYIRCKDGDRTLLRPVYTKYEYQQDLVGEIENYIDAIQY